MDIYVTGPKGRLGSQLVAMGAIPIHDDILQPETVVPSDAVIINCAAVTDVDRCETDNAYYEYALDVNGRAVDRLAKFYYPMSIIHIGTDYIFAGKRGPYAENYLDYKSHDDDLVPKTCGYGFTKFVGESYASTWKNVFIVRTTGLYGGVSEKHDFVKLVVKNLRNRVPMKVTSQLRTNQTYIPHLAEALMKYAPMTNKPKVLHLASKDVVSRYEFALMVASVFELDKALLYPCTNSQVPGWVATRPIKGGLKTNLAKKLGLPIYTILEGLKDEKIAN